MADHPTALHPSLLEGIGIIVQRWAYVEALEGEFLAYLIGAKDNNLYVITQTVSGKSLTSWLRTLCDIKLTHQESREKVADLFARIDDTRAERNAVVHGLWSPGSEPITGQVQTVNVARKEMIITLLMTCPDLADLAERIGEIMRELILIGTNLGWHKATGKTRLV